MMMNRTFVMLACLVASPHHARADDVDARVVACRPTVTCTAELAPPGTVELELGYQLKRSGGAFQHGTPFLLKLPVEPWLELQLGSNGYTYASAAMRYFDDLVAGAKLHLADQGARRPSLAVTTSVSVPTASQRGYTRTYDLGIVGHASKDVGRLHLDFNVGLVVYQLGGPRAYQPFSAFAATYAATPRVSLAIEPHYIADASPLGSRDAGAIAAVEIAARSWLVVDAAIDVIGWDQRAVIAIAGVSIAPGRLWASR
jgi:hypothetical protein